MDKCTNYNCDYMWADPNEEGHALGAEYCHFKGPSGSAPCEQEITTNESNINKYEITVKVSVGDKYLYYIFENKDNLTESEIIELGVQEVLNKLNIKVKYWKERFK